MPPRPLSSPFSFFFFHRYTQSSVETRAKHAEKEATATPVVSRKADAEEIDPKAKAEFDRVSFSLFFFFLIHFD